MAEMAVADTAAGKIRPSEKPSTGFQTA